MELLIIRHAIAVDRTTPGLPDDQRALTPEGRKKFREAARGLTRIVKRPDALLTSPLLRARQTAEIAAVAWGRRPKPRELQALADGDFAGLWAMSPTSRTCSAACWEAQPPSGSRSARAALRSSSCQAR
jgi:phosphohistidine phosphatase